MSILIKEVLLEHDIVDIYIENDSIRQVGTALSVPAQKTINGKGKAAIPGFVNGHTHAAMTLARGWGDDIPLEQWLHNRIWPYEAKLTEEDVYWGAKLSCLEMIKTGTTCFNDMYAFFHGTARAVEEMGLRATLSATLFDHFDENKAEAAKKQILQYFSEAQQYSDRITFSPGPHAIYTVSGKTLQWVRDFANDHHLRVHLHLAESRTEYNNAVQQFGLSPVRYLHQLGVLAPHLIIAHCLWLDDEEIQLLADHEVKVVHNPNSNLKLASGFQFKYEEMKQAGITVGIGTDGCASSNNLDMVEAAKTASLLQKGWRFDPTAMPAPEAFACATLNGAKVLGINAGKIAAGCLADLCLVDLNIPAFTPNFDFISNLMYAANSSCIDTVICNGQLLMENKHVPGEEEILTKAAAIAHNLMYR